MINEKTLQERAFTDMNIGKFVDKDLNAIVNKIASMHGVDLQTRYDNLCEAYSELDKRHGGLMEKFNAILFENKKLIEENESLKRRVDALEWKDTQNKMLMQRYEDIIHGVEAASGKELI